MEEVDERGEVEATYNTCENKQEETEQRRNLSREKRDSSGADQENHVRERPRGACYTLLYFLAIQTQLPGGRRTPACVAPL